QGDESLRFYLFAFVAVTQGHILPCVILPGGTRRPGGNYQEDRGRSVVECGLQFGSVSSVDGKGVTHEDTLVEFSGVTRVGDRRIAGDDHDSLAFYVDSGVVVPLVFGRH